MKRLAACLLIGLLLSGCETVRGFGKDLQKAGRWMEKTAKNNP